MRSLAAIRTHKWDEDAMRLHARLKPIFGDDLAVVFHNRPKDVAPPLRVVDLNDRWVSQNGLRLLPDYGWRCGDYFFYALRQACPGYDAYWLIEPDVAFTSDPADFFGIVAGELTDALGYRPVSYPVTARFGAGVPGLDPMKAIFALTRLTGRAIDRLFDLRQAYSAGPISRKDFANDEVFVYSHVAADPELSLADLEQLLPAWFDGVQFQTDPDMLLDWVQANAPQGRVLHPVRSKASFREALAARMTANTSYLGRMGGGLALLDDADLDQIAIDAARRLRAALRAQLAAGQAGAEAAAAVGDGRAPSERKHTRRVRKRALRGISS